MERELVEQIKIKTAISLNVLLNKIRTSPHLHKERIADSYGKIASNAFIRKATATSIFNAKTNPGTATLILIVEAMGFTISDFAEIYESIKSNDVQDLEKKLVEIRKNR